MKIKEVAYATAYVKDATRRASAVALGPSLTYGLATAEMTFKGSLRSPASRKQDSTLM